MLEDAGEGRIRRTYPNEGQFYVARPNGKAAAYEGSGAVHGVTVTLSSVSETEMRWTEFINGKAYNHGIDKLSAEGKVLKETTWPVNRSEDKQQAVYQR